MVIVAYDDGEPMKVNKTLVVITVLQPSIIPVFTQEEYRYSTRTGLSGRLLFDQSGAADTGRHVK